MGGERERRSADDGRVRAATVALAERFSRAHDFSELHERLLCELVATEGVKQAAARLGMRPSTVRTQLQRMAERIGCDGESGAVRKAFLAFAAAATLDSRAAT